MPLWRFRLSHLRPNKQPQGQSPMLELAPDLRRSSRPAESAEGECSRGAAKQASAAARLRQRGHLEAPFEERTARGAAYTPRYRGKPSKEGLQVRDCPLRFGAAVHVLWYARP